MKHSEHADAVVATFPGNSRQPYRDLQDLQDELLAVIHKRNNTVALASVLGVLRLVEHTLIEEAA